MALFQRTFHRLRPTLQRSSALCVRGLEDFFEGKASVPTEAIPAGRAWSAGELHRKSFNDLHKLWYVLLKERNMLETQKLECERLKVEFVHGDRVVKCKKGMARIKTVLTEREKLWNEARAENDRIQAREAQRALKKHGNSAQGANVGKKFGKVAPPEKLTKKSMSAIGSTKASKSLNQID